MSEQQTCRAFVVPGLRASGWDKRQIREQYRITNGKIIASARRHRPGNPLVADHVLEYRDDLPLAVVEAKRTKIDAAAGIEQAKRYAQQLELPVAYATNGNEIWEIEIGGAIRQRSDFPSPDELWERFCESQGVESRLEKEMLLAAFDSSLRDYNREHKRPRYYQRIAVNRALRAIARGQRRILLTLATGTGKTMVALQLVAKLRKSGWTADRMPRVLYLADRNILVDKPKDDYFVPAFKDVVHKISKGHAQRSREVYFALYQSLEQGDEQALFSQYSKDYFDLIIVDECHRGSAGSSSQWRGILEHFDEAVQIGLTATPVRKDDADTYGYFGNPVYEYSLRDGIEDGFLAPYRVRRVRLNIDMTGFRPSPGQRDVAGDEIPDKLYTPKQYERVLAVLDRTQAAARYNIVLFRRIGSMPLFKQIIGRGTRLCLEAHKGSFDIIDFVEATRLFNDPAFDGPPLRVIEDETDEQGNRMPSEEQAEQNDAEQVAEPDAEYATQDEGPLLDEPTRSPVLRTADDDTADQIMAQGRRIYVDGVEVYVWNDVHYQLESDGQTLRLVEYREFVRDRVLSMNLSPTDLRTQWAVARSRAALRTELQSRAVEPDDLMAKLGHPEADPLDLLINAAWELPLVSRAERALRVRREHKEFLESFGPTARVVLDALLEKFTEHGAEELSARALRVPPFTELGNVIELGGLFGGRDALHEAIDDLGKHLFDVG